MKTIKSMIMISMLLMASVTYAAEYTRMAIEPKQVGVFYELKEQQFNAFGLTEEGKWVNITSEVDWYTEDMSFDEQPDEVITIDQTGMATINNTWGRVKISACYPKGCKIEPKPEPNNIVLPLSLLLNRQTGVDFDEDRYNIR